MAADAWVGAGDSEKLRWIALERLDKFVSSLYWTDVNLSRARCYPTAWRNARRPDYRRDFGVTLSVWSPPMSGEANHRFRVREALAASAAYRPCKVGDAFGPSWATHWFRAEIEVPAEFAGREVHFLWDSDSEAMVWRDGEPVQGLTGGDGGDRRAEFVLTRRCKGAERVVLFVEMACNGMFGNSTGDSIAPANPARSFTVKQAEVSDFDRELFDFYWDFQTVHAIAKELPADAARARLALRVANSVVNLFDVNDRSTMARGAALLREFLAVPAGPAEVEGRVWAVGHCHIDTAWLWPYEETKRKCARSWATQLLLMEEFAEYRFACSQAQQYEWVKEHYPALFARIKAAVASGRFVPVGGTWVEMDCNVPSGESLARQFLLGQRFFQREFGVRCGVFWLPDTFGYCAQLPQIMRLSGCSSFLTQKLSWNLVNEFPHHTFLWEAPDGSRVLTHFPPTNTYNAAADVATLVSGQRRNKEKALSADSLMLFGHGDGGGGPQAEMLERLRRLRSCNGVPQVQMASPEDFFARLSEARERLAVWSGELYFELHRGTYTSQAAIKLGNARCEEALHDVEFLGVVAALAEEGGAGGRRYRLPARDVERWWKQTLLNQFHDVLPGSCIAEARDDAVAIHRSVLGELKSETEQRALPALAAALGARPALDRGAAQLLINTRFAPRGGVAGSASLAPFSCALVFGDAGSGGSEFVTPRRVDGGGFVLENDELRVELAASGRLVSVRDLSAEEGGREVLSAPGNDLMLYDDVPLYWDAWDVELYHVQKSRPVSDAKLAVAAGDSVRLEYKVGERSSLVQHVRLARCGRRIEFACELDWHEAHKLLKVQFPLAVRAPEAAFGTQFGFVRRPTHRNTTWDVARFEVVGHRFADLSEFGFGVALLSDAKYGFAALGNVLSLSLVRAPKRPDPQCDMGRHEFKFALLPHRGAFPCRQVWDAAADFAAPPPLRVPLVSAPSWLRDPAPWFAVDRENVLLDTVKPAEDAAPPSFVLRAFEALGGRGRARITVRLPGLARRQVRCRECNLLEEPGTAVAVESSEDGALRLLLDFAPHEIKSVLVEVAGPLERRS